MLSGIFQRLAQFLDCSIHAMFEVDEGILRPKRGLELFPADDFSVRLQEEPEHLQGLFLDWHTHADAE